MLLVFFGFWLMPFGENDMKDVERILLNYFPDIYGWIPSVNWILSYQTQCSLDS